MTAPAAVAMASTGDDGSGRVVLPSARSARLISTATDPDLQQRLDLRIYLSGRDPAGRVRQAMAVSTPRNPAYAHFLTPEEFRASYGPTAAQTGQVTAWLHDQGLTATVANPHYVGFSSTVAQAQTLFKTVIKQYGRTLAPAGDVSVPVAVAPAVATVTGLQVNLDGFDQSAPPTSSKTIHASAVSSDLSCSHFWGEHQVSVPAAYGHTAAPTMVCGYTPAQMRQAYGIVNGRSTGKGATVAIILNSPAPAMEADANRFFAAHGVPGFKPGQFVRIEDGTKDCPGNGFGDSEQALDVETVHIIAPDAKIVYITTGCNAFNDTRDYLDAHTRVVDEHLADATTDSWPGDEESVSPAEAMAYDLTFEQGALEGISFNFASGDGGSADGRGLLFPGTDSWATSVGGTTMAIDRSGQVAAETGWGVYGSTIADGTYTVAPPGEFRNGSGGGRSELFAQPSYQRGLVPDTLATGGHGPAHRVVPDVAANSYGMWLTGFTDASDVGDGAPAYHEIANGGTSGSSPIVAALEADAKQASGHAVGFLNPSLARLQHTSAIRDMTPVNPTDPPTVVEAVQEKLGEPVTTVLDTLGNDGDLKLASGFDEVTGVGAVTEQFPSAFGR